MAQRLKIGVDLDGVLVDFAAAFRREAADVLGREIKGVQTTWMFEDSLEITKEEVLKVWDRIKETEDWFYLNAISQPGVTELLPWLTVQHDVFFITNRASTAGFTTQRQSAMYLDEVGVQFPTVIVVKDKGPIAAALKLDAFVDDRIENLYDIWKAKPDTRLFLMNATYNDQLDLRNKAIERVSSFEDFINKVEALSNEASSN